jgi:hypothetical protein
MAHDMIFVATGSLDGSVGGETFAFGTNKKVKL